MARRTTSRGFTLIEVLFVLVVVGVIMALAAPSFRRGIMRGRVSSAASGLYSTFTEAEGLARSKGHRFCLELDRLGRSYKLTEDADADNVTCEATVKSSTLDDNTSIQYRVAGYATAFPSPYSSLPSDSWCTVCSASTGTLYFEPDGTISLPTSGPVGGSITVYDASSATDRISALVFITRTGTVRIYEQN